MAQGHDIFKVFVAKKDGINLTAGKKLKEMLPDEVYIFDADTNLSVANLTASSRFYLAMSKDGKVIKSTNRWIDKDNVKSITVAKPVDLVNKKVTFKDFKIFCNKDYSLRVDATNALTMFEQMTNADTASLVASSVGCGNCGPTDPCQEINPIPVVYEMLRNKQRLSFVKVDVIARANITGVAGITGTVNKGTVLTDAQLKLINTHNKTKTNPNDFVKVDLVFEAIPLPKDDNQEGYLFPRNTDFVISPSESFLGNGVFEEVKNVVEQGSGFDVQHLEYKQVKQDSYRYSDFGHKTFHPKMYANPTEKYVQISLRYGHKTQVTSHLYDHTAEVVIALPSTSNITAFETVLKTINATKIGLT